MKRRKQADPVAEEAYLVKFYMDELSEVIEAADSVLLVRTNFAVHVSAFQTLKNHTPEYYVLNGRLVGQHPKYELC